MYLFSVQYTCNAHLCALGEEFLLCFSHFEFYGMFYCIQIDVRCVVYCTDCKALWGEFELQIILLIIIFIIGYSANNLVR